MTGIVRVLTTLNKTFTQVACAICYDCCMMKTILFLCSGNYYRSRFAEIVFQMLAEDAEIGWNAFSRGLALSAGNVGRISPYALTALGEYGYHIPDNLDFPQDVTEADFAAADLIIAVKETEHRPLMAQRFPDWEDEVEYWEIHDLDVSSAEESLPQLEKMVELLVEDLNYLAVPA